MKKLKPLFKKLYQYWMAFAHAMGKFNTKLILTLFFFLVITPVGLWFKLIRKDLLDQKLHTGDSYWYKRKTPKIDIQYLTKQY